MPEVDFFAVFGVVWVVAMAYGLSAFRLLVRVRGLKAQGAAAEAPDPLTSPLDVFGYVGWLMTGRYGELGDPVVTRWASIARILFVVAAPGILMVFVLAGTGMVG